ncbi:hypothetical protein RSOLAG1IB_03109 [Rhizoctonia solani AG-1 IB]|uniref:Dolichyl-diphosphooligosaccharide-protein glycosyltransferase subunit OST5 n=1 Tax=Thanatephorus cucumeris (strain AG1-IB / isolate 7/3/14) TaxID=1108050 RepID=A0A0B7FQ53_THACB|nr:hypothetical protein RSOLAG1IB_03109 [Rhizoctonia solani AG-1 IB]
MVSAHLESADYAQVKALHESLPAFAPLIPTAVLPYLAFVLLTSTFALGFYFSTLPKNIMRPHEIVVSVLASVLGGLGVVALFNSVGVYV